jgi:hypothetical protein
VAARRQISTHTCTSTTPSPFGTHGYHRKHVLSCQVVLQPIQHAWRLIYHLAHYILVFASKFGSQNFHPFATLLLIAQDTDWAVLPPPTQWDRDVFHQEQPRATAVHGNAHAHEQQVICYAHTPGAW